VADAFLHSAPRTVRRLSWRRRGVANAIECRIDDHDEAAMLIDRPERLAAPPGPKGTRQPDAGVAVELARRLRAETEGEVLFDAASPGRYATDASIYQIMPAACWSRATATSPSPRHRARARRAGVPRGAGTSQRPDDRRRWS
jgi:hypothetical protein